MGRANVPGIMGQCPWNYGTGQTVGLRHYTRRYGTSQCPWDNGTGQMVGLGHHARRYGTSMGHPKVIIAMLSGTGQDSFGMDRSMLSKCPKVLRTMEFLGSMMANLAMCAFVITHHWIHKVLVHDPNPSPSKDLPTH